MNDREKGSIKKVFNVCWLELLKEVTEKNRVRLLGYFVIISLLEILAYSKGGIFSIIASRIWILTAVLLLIIFTGYVFMKLFEDIKSKKYLLILGFSCLAFFLFYFVGNVEYGDINADATQQLAAGLSSYSVDDWNYTGVAFLGYANRQYLLGALPALLFGRSIFTLHLGFAGLFIVGLFALYFEFRNWLKEYELNETFALIPCYAIMAFRFIAEYYLNYEQAITPVALTMLGIALFMRLYRKMDVITMIALTWMGCFYCDSYTPVLASLGLLVCFLVLYAFDIYLRNIKITILEKNSEAYRNMFTKIEVLIGSAATMGCFFVATLLGKREDRFNSVREDIDLISFAKESWIEFFSDKNAVFFGVFLGGVLLYLFLALTCCLKLYDFVIAVWVLGVVLFANLLVGYTAYEKAWILQRNMLIIPVLVTAIWLCILRFLRKNKLVVGNKYLIAILISLGIVGVNNFGKEHQSFNYFRYIQPMKYMLSCAEKVIEESQVSDMDEFNIILITDNLLQSNIYDYAKFFYPNASACSMTLDGDVPDIDWNKQTFIFAESEEALSRFDVDIQRETYKNMRYQTEITWYYGEVK